MKICLSRWCFIASDGAACLSKINDYPQRYPQQSSLYFLVELHALEYKHFIHQSIFSVGLRDGRHGCSWLLDTGSNMLRRWDCARP